VAEIVKQIFQFLRRDQQLTSDQQVFQTLFTNRELAIAKLKMEAYQNKGGV
jgi:ArsR family transcriptional regulator, arsenate/arsenite/antimonite-responsive transcriptional repressor